MIIPPEIIGNLNLINQCRILPLSADRYGQALEAIWPFNIIPITPVTPSILYVVKKYELIYTGYHVKIAAPWDVTRLTDSDGRHQNKKQKDKGSPTSEKEHLDAGCLIR